MDNAFTYWIRQAGVDTLQEVHIADSASIGRLMYKITDLTGIPPGLQNLVYKESYRHVALDPGPAQQVQYPTFL